MPMILGFFLVRVIPLPAYEHLSGAEHGLAIDVPIPELEHQAQIYEHEDGSQTPLLTPASGSPRSSLGEASSYSPRHRESLELSPPRHRNPAIHNNDESTHGVRSSSHHHSANIHGIKLWSSSDFWLLFISMSLCKQDRFSSSDQSNANIFKCRELG